MEKEKDKIYFSLPGFWKLFDLNCDLLDLYATQRDLFCDDIVIDSFYDCFPCIWNGGRAVLGELTEENIRATAEPFERAGVSLRLTFTNYFTTKDDVHNYGCNMVCRLLESERNGIISFPGFLRDYIKEKYPKFYHVNSTTMYITDIDKINELSRDTLTVADYQFNNDFEALSKIDHPENIELLVAEQCIDACPNRRAHSEYEDRLQRGEPHEDFSCAHSDRSFYALSAKCAHYISPEAIREKYVPLGYNQFKISGRADHWFTNVERYVVYLVKPEHRDYVRAKLSNYAMSRNGGFDTT